MVKIHPEPSLSKQNGWKSWFRRAHFSGSRFFRQQEATVEINFGSSVSLLDRSNKAASNPFLTFLRKEGRQVWIRCPPVPRFPIMWLGLKFAGRSLASLGVWRPSSPTSLASLYLSVSPRTLAFLCFAHHTGDERGVVEKPTVGNGFRGWCWRG